MDRTSLATGIREAENDRSSHKPSTPFCGRLANTYLCRALMQEAQEPVTSFAGESSGRKRPARNFRQTAIRSGEQHLRNCELGSLSFERSALAKGSSASDRTDARARWG